MTGRRQCWRMLILVFTASVSLVGCVEEGPQGDPGPPGPAGPPGEVVIVRPPEEPAPLPPETGLTPRQAQPRVRFDAAALPSGVAQVDIITASPTRLRVAFRLTNDLGEPLERAALEPLRFTLSSLEIDPVTGLTRWRSAIFRTQESPITGLAVQQPTDETNGTFEDLGNGVVRYTFATPLPDGFDPTATHRVGVQARRRVNDRQFVDNATLDFRPDGGPVTLTREVVQTANCQRCHEPFAFHGGLRTETKVCVQCHTPQNTDPDTLDPIPENPVNPHFDPAASMQLLPNPVDFATMIHRIHQGEVLREDAGLTYQIIGFRQTVADFSEITFPQDIRNCTTCHTGTSEASNFKTAPSRAACGSCHVRTWFGESQDTPADLEPHAGGPQPDETQCTRCHTAEGAAEFDLSIAGAHTNPLRSVQAPGVNFTIVRVEDADDGDQRVDPGHHLRVVFNITDDMGQAIAPGAMNFLRLTLAGPTSDYRTQDYDGDGRETPGEPLRGSPFTTPGEDYMQLDARSASGPDAAGNFSSTFVGPIMVGNNLTITDAAIPPHASGTYAVGIEGYRCVRIEGLQESTGGINCTPGNTALDEIRDAGRNVVAYFAVTDPEPVPRRQVVDAGTRCITCHGVFSKDFSVHGNIRNNPEYCVLCHNPAHDTLGRQPPPAAEQTALTFPVNFNVMVHKIHRGHDLTRDYALFSFSGARLDVREFHFPGDLRNCQTCHIIDAAGNRTELLFPGTGVQADDVQPTLHRRIDAMKDIVETFETLPITSACTACHDRETTVAHAELNTTPAGVETCEICHGAGKQFAVERVHAR